MARGWEIVEKRGDGLWYTNMRTYIPDEGIMYRNWVLAHDPMRYVVREVSELSAQLSSSISPLAQINRGAMWSQEGRKPMIDESKARRIGQELIAALCTLFELQPARDGGAQYALGRSLAAMTGEFDDADMRDAFIQGIMEGFRQAPARISAPHTEVDG